MRNIEKMLNQVMNKKWRQHPPLPLSLDLIRPHIRFQKNTHSLFGLRTALISVILVAFSFLIWQLRTTVNGSPGTIALSLVAIPTPSTQLSTASLESSKCEWNLYIVDRLDTLDSIALKYAVSKEQIKTFNTMNSEVIYESMELKIPQCDVTPTVTVQIPTTTLTPILEFTADTPG
jgi:hypothetical protein